MQINDGLLKFGNCLMGENYKLKNIIFIMVLKFVSFIANLRGFQQAIPYRSKAQKQNCLNKNFQEE